jgi:hypothetical protein
LRFRHRAPPWSDFFTWWHSIDVRIDDSLFEIEWKDKRDSVRHSISPLALVNRRRFFPQACVDIASTYANVRPLFRIVNVTLLPLMIGLSKKYTQWPVC